MPTFLRSVTNPHVNTLSAAAAADLDVLRPCAHVVKRRECWRRVAWLRARVEMVYNITRSSDPGNNAARAVCGARKISHVQSGVTRSVKHPPSCPPFISSPSSLVRSAASARLTAPRLVSRQIKRSVGAHAVSRHIEILREALRTFERREKPAPLSASLYPYGALPYMTKSIRWISRMPSQITVRLHERKQVYNSREIICIKMIRYFV